MKKRTVAGIGICIILTITAVFLLPVISASPDTISTRSVPDACLICDRDFRYEDQGDGQCASYAAAFAMRWLGEDIDGGTLAKEIKRDLGMVTPHRIVQLLQQHGFEATAHHGTLDTLKQRVCEGTPVIVFLRSDDDTHYAVVTGYDKKYVYLADSLPANQNADERYFNRRISLSEFEELWKTPTLLPNNTYITADKKR